MRFNIPAMKKEQLRLAKKLSLKNEIDEIKLIAGVDQSYTEDKIISAIVILDYNTLEKVEYKYAVSKPKIPYIPGFLSYREAEVIVEAFNKLQNKPDLIMLDGNGILHPRKIGLASHIGLLLDTPTIGVAKRLLLGDIKNNKIYVNNELRAHMINTKEKAKPIFVSPGHKISIRRTLEIIEHTCTGNKLPLPLHMAHKISVKAKKKLP